VVIAERPGPAPATVDGAAWWRGAVIYEIYPRSFADASGDGTGDLAGVRARLPYLRDLGVDAVWFTPWYPSPMADGGYDVADYRSIDPAFGDLDEAEALIVEARALGIRTIVDVVPNHVSDQHPWFQAALVAAPGSPERARFWFRPGRGRDGEVPPNGWVSEFGGSAWSRTTSEDGSPDEWYLHLFAPGQPDLNWGHPEVRAEHEDVLRFWFDRGVAGIRIDSAALLVKDPALPDVPGHHGPGEHPYVDRDELQDIYRGWRAVADSYDDDRALIGELWLPEPARFARYLRPDVLSSAFNFDFLVCPWDAARLRASIEQTTAIHREVGAPATWVLSNHDVTRPVTRYGRADTSFSFEAKRYDTPTDLWLGLRRARAAALLTMALPGCVYLYQGEELGLPEVEDIPRRLLQDPMHFRSHGVDPGRDGCRVPMPWSGDRPPYGFSPDDADGEPWLPQPADWAGLTVESQTGIPTSTLELYRSALRLRRQLPSLGDGPMTWLPSAPEVLAFARGEDFACVVNLGTDLVALPAHDRFLLSSAALKGGCLPADTAAWLRISAPG
jgi:alpha-glucosidase